VVDLDTQMKIDTLIDFSYDKTIERINAIEDADESIVYRTMGMVSKNEASWYLAYINYYCGCMEGILFTRFLEEFSRYPSPSENVFIADTISSKFEKLKQILLDISKKQFKKHHNNI